MSDDLVCGINAVREALRGKRRAFELFVAKGEESERLRKLLDLASEAEVPVRRRERRDMDRLCGSPHHQGVALRLEPFPYAELEDLQVAWQQSERPGLLLFLDSIQDPHNLGALIRSAACAGAHGVVIPRDRAAGITPAVERASAGAVETIPVARVTNLSQAIATVKEWGFWFYGAAGEESASLYEQDFRGNVAFVIGGEGEGLRELVRRQCDVLVAIPLEGGVASLNASVAGGICLFEAVRQRRTGART
jgi:23S rRNA (guanosine2251-2'-O)-methyltransferase